MYEKWPDKVGDIRFFTGAKSGSETMPWQPELEAIRTMIEYVRATARFEIKTE